MFKKIVASFILVLALVGGGVAAYQISERDSSEGGGRLTVVASYYPLYDFARQVGGDRVRVSNMTPAGIEPHDYDPPAKALVAAHKADVFVYNGGQMEPWADGFLQDFSHVAVKASDGIELLEAERGHSHSHSHAGHDHKDESGHHDDHAGEGSSVSDPHFWLDPVLAQQIVYTIRDGLSKADPDNREYYEANAEKYSSRLSELDQAFAEALASCRLDTAISSHSAFSYLAGRYNFSFSSIAGIEPDDEPSVARMAELTNLVKDKGVKYIFFETLVSSRLADTIANETGAGTLVLDPIEGLSQADEEKGRNYISVQYDNLRNLKKALECN